MLLFKLRLASKLLLISFLSLLTLQSVAQTVPVSGVIVNSTDNSPLPGVSVSQKGAKTGTTTDAKGAFRLSLTGEKPVIEITSVGFQPITLNWDGSSSLLIKMEPAVSSMQDVVVVGYGTQKKVNLTGATQTLKLEEAVNQPVANSGQLMYGRFSGVQLTQGSGLPGSDASSVVIRGVSTFGTSTPLVVIDNIQYDNLSVFNNLSPSDIESISVLKDASAGAIYGARGANGVIIVTTKKGKNGSMSVMYNNYIGFQEVTTVPQYLNAMDYATLKNEADINRNGPSTALRYTAADIQAMRDGSNPDRFANTNWANEILRRAPIQNHYISFSGGNDRTTFRASLGYLNQEAVVQGNFKSSRYNMSLNLNSRLKDWLSISNSFNGYWSRFTGPTGGANAITGETGIINQFQRSSPTVPVYYSSGEYGTVDGAYFSTNPSFPITNPIRRGKLGTYINDDLNFANRFGVTANITKNISFETSGSFNIFNSQESDFTPRNNTYDYNGDVVSINALNVLRNSTAFNYRLLNENIMRYTRKYKEKHDISFLLGHSIQYGRNDGFAGSLKNFPTDGLQEFDAGGVTEPNVTGGASEFAIQSFFSRLNYIYDGRYMLELNMRRDASSRFGTKYRYGNFPSASAGWRISQEKFMRKMDWISDLKLRASWGITGNDNIGNYLFAQTYNVGLDYFLANTIVSATAQTILANPNIKWETIEQYDLGIDAGLFKNRLTFTADYFNRRSYDLLYSNFPVPATIGVTNLAAVNAASMVNKGVEIIANYRDRLKNGLNYSVGGSVSKFADNKVTGLGDRGLESISGISIIRVGVPYNAYFGYKAIGIFQSAADITNAPAQFNNPALTKPGDIQYADLSGPAGKPDGVVNDYDRTVIGNPYPSWIYNFNASVDYKGFDFNILFEGIGNVDRILYDNGQLPFEGDRNNVLTYWLDRWTPTNPSTKLPRLGGYSNALISSFYIQDASYLRMKNLEIGYSFPASIIKRVGLSKLRVFIGGQNLLTFTKLENFDPERARGRSTDQNVPLYKVYTAGLNLKF
jgi:TonB-linked SusC/RagA family outer membrane protein